MSALSGGKAMGAFCTASALDHREPAKAAVTVATHRLRELVERPLAIPEYQRRYCWGPEQVAMLLADIEQWLQPAEATSPQAPLFLGTIILHQEPAEITDTKDHLVDGQQRCLTLVLLLHALGVNEPLAVKQLLQAEFPDSQSQQNLAANFQQIKHYLATEPGIRLQNDKLALLDQLQFVVISISSIDQAFAFFDSQNTSGKRLSDFDLLKARHLRAVVSDASVGIGCSNLWEAYERQKVGNGQRLAYFLTEQILARTRVRQRGNKVDDLQLVKEFAVQAPKPTADGPKTIQLSPPTAVSFYRDWNVSHDANHSEADVFTFTTLVNVNGSQVAVEERSVSRLPLQLNQPLLGGEQFFFYIAKYTELYKQHFPLDITSGNSTLVEPEQQNATLHGRLLQLHRAVEQGQDAGYSRLIEIWLAMLVFYLDRFAEDERFASFATLADQYVFSLRITEGSLRRSTVENHFATNEIFADLLQCPSSLQAVALIEKLSGTQAQALLKFEPAQVEKTKKRPVIRRYLKAFASTYAAGNSPHLNSHTSLATVLHAKFFKDEQHA
ncbi:MULTISPECIES: DUF262 domain-containing protein [Pseudomonas]|uniref:DUF262 domain-containing protein n=1 Tax=Pseudomonas helleri TaxID=1608996 RepID=A0A7X2CI84_9PSED|nr:MULTISPECIES: DUF262 domain-containing protein [Pseudomonas]MQT96913.1 DUF262 domain-containing protein [Pseudomonas helleri]MQU32104.1 DUF262 domain-containing protein [Pseudomonas helleri]PAA19668.1 hypothetical protein CJU72_22325 [Pseudomonas fragi]